MCFLVLQPFRPLGGGAKRRMTFQTRGCPPLEKRERNWSRNASRNCFWDFHWARAGQLLAIFLFVVPSNVPEVLYSGELALQSFGFPGYLSSFETSLWFVFRFNSPARQLLFWKFLSLKVPQSLRLFDDISH